MVQIYACSGVWKSFQDKEWRFVADKGNCGIVLTLESTTTVEKLKMMVCEDYSVDVGFVAVELSYLPSDLVSNLESPPVVIRNDRQLRNFVEYQREKATVTLCVTFKPILKEPPDSSDKEDELNLPKKAEECRYKGKRTVDATSKRFRGEHSGSEDGIVSEDIGKSGKSGKSGKRGNLEGYVKKHEQFDSKDRLRATMEICAMKYNFDYKVTKSDTKFWCIRCKDKVCKWSLRAECVEGSTVFKINKYVGKHTCAPSNKSTFSKTASAKTIGDLIMHKYVGVKDGPKPNDIMSIMRTEHGCEISYNQAWESREYAISSVRGLPEKSFHKVPKYLHMLQQANPGTHTNYQTDSRGRFLYLFLAFGQSVRGFYKTMRRVIVVDGTFLKSKYKGTMLVATAVDGNSNLYPIAFGVVDSENDLSWEWFFRQLKVVVGDEEGLAFVSDRHVSIAPSLAKVYPLASKGICIHHLLSNMQKVCHDKGMLALIEKASKAYRVVDFERRFNRVCNISPVIGNALREADVRKWARCLFPGFRYDIRTTNPAESINSALRTPREYPIIPLLDSIREMMTRWFYERRGKSSKHQLPLTDKIEKKIERRTEKAKTLVAFPVTNHIFQIKGDLFDCVVDLQRRTCTCAKFDLCRIPCRHAIKAAYTRNIQSYTLADGIYSTAAWRMAYAESINPISVPEDEWCVPKDVEDAKVFPPKTKRRSGRRKKRRFDSLEDKIRSSQGSQGSKRQKRRHKCSRCGNEGHNRATCDIPI
ncbi:unnamed protein product [Microthlaspi erraticum]|uniref:SWIM-type domain-containing protein n=1 Tax=Microthlaspi erraticum TaxID=1685480 RepID=A0A6D2KHV8_9BRAS|nr:unnamed protein product [Microthlaspi erraticum]